MSFELIPVVQLVTMAFGFGCCKQQLSKLITRLILFGSAVLSLLRRCEPNVRWTLSPTFALSHQPVSIWSLNYHPVCRLLFSFLLRFFFFFFFLKLPSHTLKLCNYSCHSHTFSFTFCFPSHSLNLSHGQQIKEEKSLQVISQFALLKVRLR